MATCRERNQLSAAANGHLSVFPQARLVIKDGWATFITMARKSGTATRYTLEQTSTCNQCRARSAVRTFENAMAEAA